MDNKAQGGGDGLIRTLVAQPYLLLVLAPTFWGGNMVASKLAVGEIDPFLFLVFRWVGAVLLLLPFVVPALRRDWPKISGSLLWLCLYGALGFAGFNMLIYGAAHFTAAVNISIEQAAIPVMVLSGNFIVFRVRARLLQIVGLVFTIAGVVWVVTHGEPQRLVDLSINIGDGMVLLAALLYAVYSLTLRYRPNIHWLSFMFVTSVAALLASVLFLFAFGGGMATLVAGLAETTLIGWGAVAYVMLFPSIIAQLCYARGVEIVGPNRASLFINLLPITGTVLSVLVLGEHLEPFHLLAAALVVVGITLSEHAMRARP
ncbi:MAG: DMT family transporter [Alphaproteobacteria bacterium]|nr:DMT family transporter [Alphaproteobacteria bacterium]